MKTSVIVIARIQPVNSKKSILLTKDGRPRQRKIKLEPLGEKARQG